MTTRFINGRTIDGQPLELFAFEGSVVESKAGSETEQVDLGGRLVLPAFGEPHAHLDKAMLADRLPNPVGDLLGAIEIMRAGWATISEDDVYERAIATARRLVAAGTTLIRSHTDTNMFAGLKSVRALLSAREQLAPICELEVVAMAHPLTGPDGPEGRRILYEAIELGADVIGGVPHIEEDPHGAIDHLLNLAVETRLGVDLHTDEVLDANYDTLTHLADQVVRHGLEGSVTASHCVSHGLKPVDEQTRIAEACAQAGIGVVTLPRTNLFLQARGRLQAPPRATVGIETMVRNGVTVAAGADNCQDPFYSIGRCDPLETASLLVSVGHRTPEEAYEMVSGQVRALTNRLPITLEPGSRADFVAIDTQSVRSAIADQPAGRTVVFGGRVVATTTVDTWVAD